MKAVIAEQYGGVEVLEISDDLPVPRVGPNGVLVEVHAASVNPVDWKLRQGLLNAVMPVVFPVIWGCDLSGVVTEVGPSVTLFKPGDEVYGMKDGYVAKTYRGTYAEYVVVPEKSLAAKPKTLSHEEAAAVPAADDRVASHGEPGQAQAGAAGADSCGSRRRGSNGDPDCEGFGAFVAATASTGNQDLLRELGADLAIDYTREKIGKVRPKFDLVLDGVGESVWAESFRALKIGGRLITLTPPIPEQATGKPWFFATAVSGMVRGVTRGLLGGKRLSMTRVKPVAANWRRSLR